VNKNNNHDSVFAPFFPATDETVISPLSSAVKKKSKEESNPINTKEVAFVHGHYGADTHVVALGLAARKAALVPMSADPEVELGREAKQRRLPRSSTTGSASYRQQVLQVLVRVCDAGQVHEVLVQRPLIADRLVVLARGLKFRDGLDQRRVLV